MSIMKEEKNYRSSTGVSGFHYGDIGDGITADEVHNVKFLQNINVEYPQEIVRAYGDNTTAEMASTSGDGTITGGFHKIPIQDKIRVLGWEVSDDDLVGAGDEDNSPYVGVIFYKTFEDGSTEYVGLPKAKFTRPNIEQETKGESTEFSSEEIVANFMDREVSGFKKQRSLIFGFDENGETSDRDKIFMAIYGKPYPGDEPSQGKITILYYENDEVVGQEIHHGDDGDPYTIEPEAPAGYELVGVPSNITGSYDKDKPRTVIVEVEIEEE